MCADGGVLFAVRAQPKRDRSDGDVVGPFFVEGERAAPPRATFRLPLVLWVIVLCPSTAFSLPAVLPHSAQLPTAVL